MENNCRPPNNCRDKYGGARRDRTADLYFDEVVIHDGIHLSIMNNSLAISVSIRIMESASIHPPMSVPHLGRGWQLSCGLCQ